MSPALRSSRSPSSSSSTRHGVAAPLQKAFRSAAILRGPRPAASHTNRIGPLGLDRRPLLDAHLELPPIAEVVLVQEPFVEAEVQVGQLHFPCITAGEPAEEWHGVVLLTNAESMEVEVRPIKADLQDNVQIGPGCSRTGRESAARASGESFASRRGRGKLRTGDLVPWRRQLIPLPTPRLPLAPDLKCSRDQGEMAVFVRIFMVRGSQWGSLP